MDQQAMTAFVNRVLADAERTFGPRADAVIVDRFAREAAIDFWANATTPVTVSAVASALRALRQARKCGRRAGGAV